MSPFSAFAWWTVRLSDFGRRSVNIRVEICCLRLVTINTGALAPSFTRLEGMPMLTIEGLIAVISLTLTAFGLGYAIGRNSGNKQE